LQSDLHTLELRLAPRTSVSARLHVATPALAFDFQLARTRPDLEPLDAIDRILRSALRREGTIVVRNDGAGPQESETSHRDLCHCHGPVTPKNACALDAAGKHKVAKGSERQGTNACTRLLTNIAQVPERS